MFISYHKGTRGGIFYNLKENKVIVCTHTTFLEEDYMNNFKPMNKVVLKEVDSIRDPQETPNFRPLFPIDVQRREYVQHVPKGEQTQETTQDQIQKTHERENNEKVGNLNHMNHKANTTTDAVNL